MKYVGSTPTSPTILKEEKMTEKQYTCPCYQCLTYAICKKMEFSTIIIKCSLLRDYLFVGRNRIDIKCITQFCDIMEKTLDKRSHSYVIKDI